MWPIASTQTFTDHFENNGLEQSECATLSADFMADATEICEMDMVTFTDLSAGSITSWDWTFEGGDPATSTEQNPVVTYNEEGSYSVELEVSDGAETVTTTMDDYIQVAMTPPTMLLAFDDVCDTDPAFELTGGSPAGGVYTGVGVDNGWFDPAVAGQGTHTITYTYTASNGCDNYDEQPLFVDVCSGLLEEQNEAFQLYPNPSTGEFEIQMQHSGDVTIRVFNLLGTEVYNHQTTSNGLLKEKINIGEFQDGVYLISITTQENTFLKKLRLMN